MDDSEFTARLIERLRERNAELEQRPGPTEGFWRGVLFALGIEAAFVALGLCFYWLFR